MLPLTTHLMVFNRLILLQKASSPSVDLKTELDQLYAITKHIVFIDTSPDEDRFDSVKPNLKRIVEKIIDSFIEKQHTSIGFIGGQILISIQIGGFRYS